ncbi:FecCD family ABC transporter permease [Streptomyces boluensis]|uniref:Iron chelate uptake ABC transporter family permease subunit n=1 Tax=Streptomyces boluensis TaxID=1775135 RepID=A0A964XR94_9ACTN|nr:iron ABC transporter permease [Streptomyces boluensis]NBE56617.1 iron chelate uptake ABC transporter family permease subunit [Streptomyces boluensis]
MSITQEGGAPRADTEPPISRVNRTHRPTLLAAAALVLLLLVLVLASLLIGTGSSPAGRAWDFLLGDPTARADAQIRLAVLDVRLPRTVAAVLVGIALGASGCLLQAVTRNPLAETGLLGVNSGAALGVVTGLTYFGVDSPYAMLLWALAGGMAASAVVLLLAASGRTAGSPLRLVLAGSALGATFHGLTSYVLLSTQSTFDTYRYWTIGSLAGIKTSDTYPLMPLIAVGLVIAFCCTRPLAALALGDDSARSLGHHPGRIRLVVAAAVTLLAGSAVALAGPVAFLGLLAPYAARTVSGPRIASQLALSALVAANVMIVADLLARVVIRPWETPVSVLLAFIGGPLLIWIARSDKLSTAGASA